MDEPDLRLGTKFSKKQALPRRRHSAVTRRKKLKTHSTQTDLVHGLPLHDLADVSKGMKDLQASLASVTDEVHDLLPMKTLLEQIKSAQDGMTSVLSEIKTLINRDSNSKDKVASRRNTKASAVPESQAIKEARAAQQQFLDSSRQVQSQQTERLHDFVATQTAQMDALRTEITTVCGRLQEHEELQKAREELIQAKEQLKSTQAQLAVTEAMYTDASKMTLGSAMRIHEALKEHAKNMADFVRAVVPQPSQSQSSSNHQDLLPPARSMLG